MLEHELCIQLSLQKVNVPKCLKKKTTLEPVFAVPLLPAAWHRRVFYVTAMITVAVLAWAMADGVDWASNFDARTTSLMTRGGVSLWADRKHLLPTVVIPAIVWSDGRNIKSSHESISSPSDTWNLRSWNRRQRWVQPINLSPDGVVDVPVTVRARIQRPARPLLLPFTEIPCWINTDANRTWVGGAGEAEFESSTAVQVSGRKTNIWDEDNQQPASRAEAGPTPPHKQRHEQKVDKVDRSSIRQVTSSSIALLSDGNQPPSSTSRNGPIVTQSRATSAGSAFQISITRPTTLCLWTVERSFVGGPGSSSPTIHHHPPYLVIILAINLIPLGHSPPVEGCQSFFFSVHGFE